MQTNRSTTGQATAQASMVEIERSMRNGANWVYWIAGLSMVNSIVAAFGSELNFVVGVGVTQSDVGIKYVRVIACSSGEHVIARTAVQAVRSAVSGHRVVS